MKAINLFGKMLTFSRLKINTPDTDAICTELARLTQKTPNPIPVVLDVGFDERLDVGFDLEELVDRLWQLDVQPIGMVAGRFDETARALRLPTFPDSGKRIERIYEPKTNPEAPPIAEPQITSSVHNQMLRSGQSVQHLGGDLIIIGGVNSGAEAITDSSLHIYGHGQGRLVAGATGDPNARIFCQKFNPSLVSVAGTYCLNDAIPPEVLDKAVQVSFDNEKGLVFRVMAC